MNRPHLIEGLGASDTATGLGGGAAASFFAQAYTLGGKTVISYRGTDPHGMRQAVGSPAQGLLARG